VQIKFLKYMKMHTRDNYYRYDIDALRALSVLAVLFFHLGVFPNGYLGVDVFFVISGFLITKIINNEFSSNKFSIKNFYIKRFRRILPLVMVLNIVVLIFGLLLMLPDDLENLAQSIIATNFFGNNFLLLFTTRDYWNVINEFKPLMHTWSLAIEEQFYFIYPLIFLFFKNIKSIKLIILLLTVVSLFFYFSNYLSSSKFYLLNFRFFELSIGGLTSFYSLNFCRYKYYFKNILFFIIILILSRIFYQLHSLNIIFVVFATALFLLIEDNENSYFLKLYKNKIVNIIGLISFSVYMWHQPVLAFIRYKFGNIEVAFIPLIVIFIFFISYFSYIYVESYFRNNNKTSVKTSLIFVLLCFFITSTISFYLYKVKGVIKNVPELGLYIKNNQKINHTQYNDRIYNFNDTFKTTKVKILLIGNSYSRDFANVILESKYKDSFEISYIQDYNTEQSLNKKYNQSDFIFISDITYDSFIKFTHYNNFNPTKFFIIGPKYFGNSMGQFYNPYSSDKNKYNKKIAIPPDIIRLNDNYQKLYKDNYINIIKYSKDSLNRVRIYTDEKLFLSQDCRHFTESGAKYYSKLLEPYINLFIK
jgi:peptidoglycan/LPS O-acetylase OafA/YrhL